MQVGYEKLAIFDQYRIRFISETIQDKAIFCRMLVESRTRSIEWCHFSMTLNDPQSGSLPIHLSVVSSFIDMSTEHLSLKVSQGHRQ